MILADREVIVEERAHPWTVDGANGDKLVHCRDEKVDIGPVTYRRWEQTCGSPISLPLMDHFRAVGTEIPAETPEVLCGRCLLAEFTLHYGSYEIAARCVACGNEGVVYSG